MFLDRDTARIHYVVWGENGPWVTLINGFTRPHSDFRLLGRHLVEKGFRVLTFDNRGAGESEARAPFTLDDWALDVVALWDALGITASHVAGISMGGFVSQRLTKLNPSRVARLALISTAATHQRVVGTDQPWGTTIESVEARLRPYFSPGFLERNRLLVKSMAKQILKAIEAGSFEAGAALQRQAGESFDARSWLPTVDAETLIVHGTEDRVIPFAAARELEALLPNARLAPLQGVGHLLLAEAPLALYQALSGFFGA